MGDVSSNFSRIEFACKCGCGFDKIEPRLVFMLQRIRDALGEPLRVNSGCRCERHNAKVGGVEKSWHMEGLAADLSCASGSGRLYAVIRELYEGGRIKQLAYCRRYVSRDFVHVDCGEKRTQQRFVEK